MAGGNRLVEAVQCWIVEGTGLLARVNMALALSTTHPRRQKQKSPSGGADGLAAINATAQRRGAMMQSVSARRRLSPERQDAYGLAPCSRCRLQQRL
jgi:hypothetical protein